MPHIIVEHSKNSLNTNTVSELMKQLETAISATGLFRMQNLKLRVFEAEHYLLASNLNGFVHIQCRIHKGRTPEEKKALSSTLVNETKAFTRQKIVITCEVVDMDTETYSKSIC